MVKQRNNKLNHLKLSYIIPYANKSIYTNIQGKIPYGCWDNAWVIYCLYYVFKGARVDRVRGTAVNYVS
jgi:hypothetical protein